MQVQQRAWVQGDGRDAQDDTRDLILSPAIFTLQRARSRSSASPCAARRMRGASAPTGCWSAKCRARRSRSAPDASGFRVALRMDLPLFVAPMQPAAVGAVLRVRSRGGAAASFVTRAPDIFATRTSSCCRRGARSPSCRSSRSCRAANEHLIFRASDWRAAASSGCRRTAMLARSTPPWPTRASVGRAARPSLWQSARQSAGAEVTPDVAALTAAAEQDLRGRDGQLQRRPTGRSRLHPARRATRLLVDSDTLRRLAIRYDSSIAAERDGRLLVPVAAISGLIWRRRHQAAAPHPDVRSARAGH